MYHLPMAILTNGQSGTMRSAPRLTREQAHLREQRSATATTISQEEALDQLWKDQVSFFEFMRLLEEERRAEDEPELTRRQSAAMGNDA